MIAFPWYTNPSALMATACMPARAIASNAGPISSSDRTSNVCITNPSEPAAALVTSIYKREVLESGLTSNATWESLGIVSLRNCNRLPIRSGAKFDNPVIFPLGRAKLSTSLLPTGSGRNIKIIGVVFVASLKADAAWIPAPTNASTFNDTRSAAMLLNRSGISLGKRCSSAMLRPSTYPRFLKPSTSAVNNGPSSSGLPACHRTPFLGCGPSAARAPRAATSPLCH